MGRTCISKRLSNRLGYLALASFLALAPLKVLAQDSGIRYNLGFTRSWPKQKEANAAIHDIENQVRQIAPAVRNFEDWDDVLNGTYDFWISKNLKLGKWVLDFQPSLSYSSGSVKTSQESLESVLGSSLNYDFKETYEFFRFESGLGIVAKAKDRFSLIYSIFPSFNMLGADTTLNITLPEAGITRKVKGNFSKSALGIGAGVMGEWKISEKLSLLGNLRYDWLKFKGDANVTDTQSGPLGTLEQEYKQRTVSDLTGPAISLYLGWRF